MPTRRIRQRGQALVETALSLIIIFVALCAIIELCTLVYTYNVMANAANEGVRYAMVHSEADPAGTRAVVLAFAKASLHDVSAMTVSVVPPEGDYIPPHKVRVTLTYTYVPWLAILTTPPTISTSAEGTMVAQ